MHLNYLEAGKGPAIVLLHDSGLGPECWRAQLAPLTEAGFRVIIPDFSNLKQVASLEDHSRGLILLLNHLGIGRALMCGLGFGGTILLHLLTGFEARVAGACFVATRPVADDIAEAARRAELLTALQRQQDQRVRRNLTETFIESRESFFSEAQRQNIQQMIDACTNASLISALQAMANRRDYTEVLPRLRLPSLVIGGEFDPICHPGHTHIMASQLRACCQAVNLPAGHLIPIEQAQAFNGLLLEFVQQLLPQRYLSDAETSQQAA
jgi:pimeloyl-ACP methyl ester carboxylesterase